MNVYAVDGGVVKGLVITNFNHYPVSILKDWIAKGKHRIVYTLNKGIWYQLNPNSGMWMVRENKPKSVAMAELVDAVAPVNLKDLANEVSTNSFFS